MLICAPDIKREAPETEMNRHLAVEKAKMVMKTHSSNWPMSTRTDKVNGAMNKLPRPQIAKATQIAIATQIAKARLTRCGTKACYSGGTNR